MPVIREVHSDSWCVRLDLSGQVLSLEVPEFTFSWGNEGEQAQPLLPSPPTAEAGPVSAATLLQKAKQFDDGLYAAVDLAAQRGAGRFAGKAALLRSLAQTLAAGQHEAADAAAAVLAACELGGIPVPAPAALQDSVHALVSNFLADELASKPLGFYTWSHELSAVFRQDRFLQQPLKAATADALALARETHVKQLDDGMAGCAGPLERPIFVCPALSVEPLSEVYARRAASYRFVRAVLEEAFGAEALGGLHRLTHQGPVEVSLADELDTTEKLFNGAAATARSELGMEPASGDEDVARRFAEWRCNLGADQDVSRDCRMMVPVFFDMQRRKTKVWAFLGWRTVPVDVEYRKEPVVLGVERDLPPEPEPTNRFTLLKWKFRRQPKALPAGPPPVAFCGDRYEFAVPVMAEGYVTRLLDRDEFRRHCDRHGTRDAILANLV